ncbi:MAG: hypothetical protein MRZ37_02240 [Tenericutes bacterium]|nr:hypothetical protein [Mycoplasmatota bacterium]
MKLKHFQTNKEVYKIEIERLLIYYKAIYRLGIEQKNKINKQIIRNKKDKIKSIEVDIDNLRDKISNLDTLYRFINGEPFKVEQLKTIVVEKVITENDILHELVDSIEEKIDIITIIDLELKNIELNKEIYIEEITSDFKVLTKANRQ